ncbi:hypothetical protein TrLO_g11165 [Triparma laevis f. longispina]|uniref:Uncharacterized protein n=1 Tax=Triparma laevis f. longispina TaxID=1714387 RepID=A0A9W7FE73_9STRA|nr:hypothetical protein TrLO_g11165 [Triparma laevis f. longispina]
MSKSTMMVLSLATKGWNMAADAFINEGVELGEIIVHGGGDITDDGETHKRHDEITRVIFLLNITKVGGSACEWVVNLVVVDNPEGVKSICDYAFKDCSSSTTVSFPTTLKSIVRLALCS